MVAFSQSVWLHKKGCSESEYEDACLPRRRALRHRGRFRFAVADGATETSFSGVWARLLVSAFVRGEIDLTFSAAELEPLRAKWGKLVRRKPMPWYAEEKLSSGAFSSLLGLEISEEQTGNGPLGIWRATSFGDSCMIQMRGEKMLAAFPLNNSADFTNRPDLISSLYIPEVIERGAATKLEGTWTSDDTFLLMTDALGCWFFKDKESGGQPWNRLRHFGCQSPGDFADWINGLRESHEIKNDDVTLIYVNVKR